MNAATGKLITLEGIDGSGKSSQLEMMSQWLQQNNIDHITTYEPGSTPLGKKIRPLLMAENNDGIDAYAEMFLFFADRAQHLSHIVQPALARGQWVISDRFYDSSYAYQGGGRNIPQACIDALVRWGCFGIQPDLTILLDIAPEHAWLRMKQTCSRAHAGREKDASRFEQEGKKFFAQVRGAYLQQAEREPQRWRIVHAEREQRLVRDDIIAILEQLRQAAGD